MTMLSRSSFNLLNLDDYSCVIDRPRIPRVMTVPGILFEEDENGENRNLTSGKRIIVANQLPLKAMFDVNTKKWLFEYDPDSLIFPLKSGLQTGPRLESRSQPGPDCVFVGSLSVDIHPSEQEEVAQMLLEKFQCVPTFLNLEVQNNYYHGFCKHYLWPTFHYMLPITRTSGVRFDKVAWQAYVSANKVFADKVMEVINPDEDYVWIHDYHLMVMPTFLRKRFHRIRVGFFLHSPFPSSEIYRTIPVRDEILRALLNCDLIGFHTFDYARHFLSCCSRMLGLDYKSKRGYIGLEYYGRTVSIKILPYGIDMGQIESVKSSPKTVTKVEELSRRYDGKVVVLGVDDMDMFKGISLKFLAFRDLLENYPSLRGLVVLVQILNPARSQGQDVQELEKEMHNVAREVNRRFSFEGYDPIVFITGPVSISDKVAYYSIAECVVVNAVRDGMNLVPYKYTVSRQGNSELDEVFRRYEPHGDTKPKRSIIIVSEFIGCSPSLSGAIRVNPWNIDSVTEAMNLAITMPEKEKEMRHEKHYKYISSHDVAYWANSFDQDLERACKEHFHKRCWGVGFGLNFRVVALGPNFRKLSVEHIVSSYNKTSSRLILLDYDGTVMSRCLIDKSPSKEVISILNNLSNDPKNVVFIVSGRGKDVLGPWFDPCKKLGLSAEHGYFTRWTADADWESCGTMVDVEWKKVALPVMEHYTEATDGSFIEQKESALVWHHQEADPDFGTWQSKELLDHLESVLANEPVVVKRGQQIVEVNPQGVSKGGVVDLLVTTMKSRGRPPDFVLCIGDDQSDEDMFEKISSSLGNGIAEVFACTVGQKPSMAKYYLDDTVDVIKMLHGLEESSIHVPKSAGFHVESQC
uniref:probable alpha,alpha-trehalose-phosphate synthase [UDP-forming] 11 n=1 Tax=Erigeron canadensis TaxID=72917 RepID=UPI001CB965B2|nr:probable alpha,alpha-trehalose-phosphate synthase [UDP-forming] 11 [Erigeron canadensis]